MVHCLLEDGVLSRPGCSHIVTLGCESTLAVGFEFPWSMRFGPGSFGSENMPAESVVVEVSGRQRGIALITEMMPPAIAFRPREVKRASGLDAADFNPVPSSPLIQL